MKPEMIALIFDIPKDKTALRVRTWRELRRVGAELRFRSLWSMPHTKRNLSDLKFIMKDIRKFGGKAEVVTFKVIFLHYLEYINSMIDRIWEI